MSQPQVTAHAWPDAWARWAPPRPQQHAVKLGSVDRLWLCLAIVRAAAIAVLLAAVGTITGQLFDHWALTGPMRFSIPVMRLDPCPLNVFCRMSAYAPVSRFTLHPDAFPFSSVLIAAAALAAIIVCSLSMRLRPRSMRNGTQITVELVQGAVGVALVWLLIVQATLSALSVAMIHAPASHGAYVYVVSVGVGVVDAFLEKTGMVAASLVPLVCVWLIAWIGTRRLERHRAIQEICSRAMMAMSMIGLVSACVLGINSLFLTVAGDPMSAVAWTLVLALVTIGLLVGSIVGRAESRRVPSPITLVYFGALAAVFAIGSIAVGGVVLLGIGKSLTGTPVWVDTGATIASLLVVAGACLYHLDGFRTTRMILTR